MRFAFLLPLLVLATSCASTRVLRLENHVLRQENEVLREQAALVGARVSDGDFALDPTLETLHDWLVEADYHVTYNAAEELLHLEFTGEQSEFSVNIQLFEDQEVVFMSTGSYLSLADTRDTDSITLLLVQLVTYNYDMLLGKYQVEPETGALALSMELMTDDGLGRDAFLEYLMLLVSTADEHYPTLHGLAQGEGL